MTNYYDPLFTELERLVKASPELAAAFAGKKGWIGWGLPPEAAKGPIPCIRLDGVGSTNNGESDEHTVILNVWTEPHKTDRLTNLAKLLELQLNESDMIACSGFVTRQENNYGRAIYPLRFTL